MSENDSVHILIVDDDADFSKSSFEAAMQTGTKARALHPNDVFIENLRWADVVLVDQRLERWPEREEVDVIGLQPKSGVALAAVYRDYVDSLSRHRRLTAFAVYSAHLSDLSGRLPPDSNAHSIARLNNLEWVFSKTEENLARRVTMLAQAVRQLPMTWPASEGAESETLARELLCLDAEKAWADRSWDDVLRCQVPLVDLEAGAHGLLFVRWLLQGVLPFPTFLWDEHWVGAQLRVAPASILEVVQGDSDLARELDHLSYKGVLRGFGGTRWWKSGVEQFAWKIRSKGARGASEFHARVQEMAGQRLDRVDASSPVVCVGMDLRPTGAIVDLEAAVRLIPDSWPAFADYPLAEISLVLEIPALRAIVHPVDIDALEEEN